MNVGSLKYYQHNSLPKHNKEHPAQQVVQDAHCVRAGVLSR